MVGETRRCSNACRYKRVEVASSLRDCSSVLPCCSLVGTSGKCAHFSLKLGCGNCLTCPSVFRVCLPGLLQQNKRAASRDANQCRLYEKDVCSKSHHRPQSIAATSGYIPDHTAAVADDSQGSVVAAATAGAAAVINCGKADIGGIFPAGRCAGNRIQELGKTSGGGGD